MTEIEPQKGAIAICGAGSLGLITADEKQLVTYDDGSEAMAWTGIHLTGKLENAEPGDDWSSRGPDVIANLGALLLGRLTGFRKALGEEADSPTGARSSHNTQYTVEVGPPLVRPGMTIKAGDVSEDYLVETADRLMQRVRKINNS